MSANGVSLQFVDTNILVYAHDQSAREKHTLAKRLIQDLWERQTGCLSIQVLQEFYVTECRANFAHRPAALAHAQSNRDDGADRYPGVHHP